MGPVPRREARGRGGGHSPVLSRGLKLCVEEDGYWYVATNPPPVRWWNPLVGRSHGHGRSTLLEAVAFYATFGHWRFW